MNSVLAVAIALVASIVGGVVVTMFLTNNGMNPQDAFNSGMWFMAVAGVGSAILIWIVDNVTD